MAGCDDGVCGMTVALVAKWPVLARHDRAMEWLQIWTDLGRAPRTMDAYARGLAEYLQVCEREGIDPLTATRAQVALFVRELTLRPSRRGTNVVALDSGSGLANATLQQRLSAISAFYEFHQRHGVDLGDLLTTWQRRGTRGGSWRPLLAHLGTRPERSKLIRLRAERRIPDTLDGEQIAAIVAACDRLRDRFLFTLLSEGGLRIGEALGLRHSDIDAAARLVSVVPRRNSNRARAKGAGGGRQVPVPARVIRLYAD